MLFMVALRAGDGRYDAFAERFAEKVVVAGPEDLDALRATMRGGWSGSA